MDVDEDVIEESTLSDYTGKDAGRKPAQTGKSEV
jgi:hypothetical protein